MRIQIPTNYNFDEQNPLTDLEIHSNPKSRFSEKIGIFYDTRKSSKKILEKLFSTLISISSKDLNNEGLYKNLVISSIQRKEFPEKKDNLILKIYSKKIDDNTQYHIQTGLYTGVIYYPIDGDIIEFHIIPKFGKILLNRMLNVSNRIYVDTGTLRSKENKKDVDYFGYIVEYLFLHAFEKARLIGYPRRYKIVQEQSSKYRGSLNITKHIKKDLPFLGRMSISYREQQISREIINVIFSALKRFSKSAYNEKKVKQLEQELKPLATSQFVTNTDIQKALKCTAIQNPLFSQFKKS